MTAACRIAGMALALLGVAGAASAQPSALFERLSGSHLADITRNGEIHVLPVQGQVFMVVAGGVNLTAQVGDDGILLVDTGPARLTDALLETLRQRFGNKPVRYIINTHADDDHVGGNAAIVRAMRERGLQSQSGGAVGNMAAFRNTYQIIALESAIQRMSGSEPGEPEVPADGLPTLPFLSEPMKLHFNGEPIQIIPVPNAHSDGDVIVFFRGSDVIAAGDVYVPTSFPVVHAGQGGSVAGTLAALNLLLDLTVPEYNQQGGTRVIPGHGHLSNEADVDDYRNWMTIVYDRVKAMVDEGLSAEQVKAARPTLDFDALYDGNPAWTGAHFVDVVLAELREAGETASRR